jgi:ketol-acid reductoisomerase
LIYEGGITGMRQRVSDTAKYGDMTRGPRVIGAETRAEMKRVLNEVQTGQFAREWILENQVNRPVFNATFQRDANHLVEQVGARLRSMMPWIKQKS